MVAKSLILSATLATFCNASIVQSHPNKNDPTIEDFNYGPDVVPTGTSFKATLTASDPLGIDRVTFKAYPNNGFWYPCLEVTNFSLVNGTVFDGVWQVECPIPAGKSG